MESLPFIFSAQLKWKITRHLVFWLSWFVFQVLIYSFSPSPVLQMHNFWVRLSMTAPESLVYMVPHLFAAYTLMYIVVPRLVINGLYSRALEISILIFLFTAVLSAGLSMTAIEYLRQENIKPMVPAGMMTDPTPFYFQLGQSVMAGLRGGITIGGLAAAIKLMKCFYERQQAALRLEKERARTELQMLKAQLHPHFLFNTLNNIYSYTQEVSVIASNMIHGLSELLRYMLYECNQPFVPLDKELKMISDYIALEKVRYDDHLDLSVNLPAESGQVRIAPLLLLPLVENCFKHGASKMVRNPWISINVTLNDTVLSMKLVNGKAEGTERSQAGIGTANTQKRLELIYAGRYEFQAVDEVDMYIVNLKLWLDEAKQVTDIKDIEDETRKDFQLSDR